MLWDDESVQLGLVADRHFPFEFEEPGITLSALLKGTECERQCVIL